MSDVVHQPSKANAGWENDEELGRVQAEVAQGFTLRADTGAAHLTLSDADFKALDEQGRAERAAGQDGAPCEKCHRLVMVRCQCSPPTSKPNLRSTCRRCVHLHGA